MLALSCALFASLGTTLHAAASISRSSYSNRTSSTVAPLSNVGDPSAIRGRRCVVAVHHVGGDRMPIIHSPIWHRCKISCGISGPPQRLSEDRI